MKTRTPLSIRRRKLNVFIACLLSFSLFTMPFVPMASAMSRSDQQASLLRRNKSSQASPTAKVNVASAPVAAPAPEPFAPVITATKVDALINDDGDGKADPGTTEKIEYTVTISNTGTTDATNVQFTDTFDTHTTLVNGSITTQPIAVNDTFSALGNVRIQVPDGASDLLANDCDPDPAGGPCTNAGLTLTAIGGDNTSPFTSGTSAQGGQVTGAADGSFTYNPAPGFEGADTFTYTVSDASGKTDTATVTVNVAGMIWFVNAAAPAGGDGRLTSPFNCLVGTGCFSPVAADDAGDNIFMFSGTYNDTGVLALLNNQRLFGAAATASLTGAGSLTGLTAPTFSDAMPSTGQPSPVINSTGSGVQLGTGNILRGFTVGNTSTAAGNYDIMNTSTATVGTLTILEVILNGTGGLFRADGGGTLNVTFPTATTTSAGSNGFQIASASGSVTVSGGAISGVAGTDVVINGGSVAFSFGAGITHAANSATVDITNHATGAVSFSGAVSATNGTGLNFNNADSTYTFGVVTLNGGDAAIDINGGSVGTFSFAAGSAITSPNGGPAFNVSGSSSPQVTYSGSITQNNAQRVVNIDGTGSNTITFNTGTVTGGASSTGVNINNANGNVTFSNGMTMGTSGARMTNQAITINNGTGTYNLGAISVFTNGAQGLVALGADGTVNATGSVNTTNTGAVANLAAIRVDGPVGLTTLGMTFSSVDANATAFGIQLIDTGGNFTVSGSATGNDRCGGAVTVNPVGTVAGFTAPTTGECNGGTLTNITTSGVQATNASNISLSRMFFSNANTADGGAAGGTCDLGDVSTCNGAVDLTTVTNVTLSKINIVGAEEQGIVGSSVTGFSLTNSNVQNAGNAAAENGVYFINLFGTVAVSGSRFTGSAFNNFGVLNSSAGTQLNMNVSSSIFSSNSSIGGDGLVIDTRGGTNSNIHVTTSTFTANKDDHFNAVSSSNAITNVTFDDNTMTGGHASPTGQGIALRVAGPFSGTFRFDIDGNSLNGAIPTAINTGMGSSTSAAVMHGFIRNNTVGTSGSALSGSTQGSCILVENNGLGQSGHATAAGTFNALVTNNTLRQCFDRGIDVLGVRDGNNTLNITVSNNNVNELTNAASRAALQLESGSSLADETGNICADILNNTWTATTFVTEMNVRARSITTFRFPGYTGGTTDTAALVTYLQGRNPAGGQAAATNSGTSTFNNTIPAGSACTQPTAPTLPSGPITSIAANSAPESHQMSAVNKNVESTPKVAKVQASSVKPAPAAKATAQKSEPRSNEAVAEVRSATSEKGKVRSHHATLKPRAMAMAAPFVAGTVGPIIIGTLRPGDSVVITFQVTVNNPPNLSGPVNPQVENQGSVSYAESGTPVLTDDPAVVGGADKTATPVDLFNSKTTLISSLNPANQGDSITFTATVEIDPAQTPTPPSPLSPTGTVTFKSDGVNIGTCVNVGLTPGPGGTATAECTTSALTPPSHNITAEYSGDGNYDPSTSNTVSQTIIACLTNPVVTNTNDSGLGSLRDAVTGVCNAPNNNVTFNIAGAGPHTITLTTGEIPVAKNVNIRNDSGKSITVSGGNASRVFNINAGKTAVIIGLTISGGNAANGGGILNDGTLTVVNSTLTGNTATSDGAGIQSTATATSLTLINTTVSGNTANGFGGGVDVLGGTATITNSTITNNHGDNDNGGGGGAGGLRNQGGTVILKNTIVAGNFAGSGTGTRNDIEGAIDGTSSNNLIGDGTNMTGITNGSQGNQVGSSGSPINPQLGALANNGGTTQTHALLPVSTAIDAGSNANLPADTFDLDGDANVAEPLPVDQRGVGFPRQIGTSVDIGAFELGQADLSITKTDGVLSKAPGTSVTYTIVVTNSGPSAVTGASVSDTFPAALTGVTFTSVAAGGATGNTAAGSGNISDTLNMPSSSSVTYTVNATIASSATGSLSNTATVTAPGNVVDPVPGNNSATDTDTLTPTADLSITKTDGVTSKVPGTSVTYTIVVTNNGPSDAGGATVSDTFPAELTGVTFTSVAAGGATGNTAAGSGNISDTLTLMPAGSSVTYTVNATIQATATGSLSNTATVTAPGGVTDPTPGNNSATDTDTLTGQADLSITKTDGVSSVVPGNSVTYTIVVTNNGPSAVSGASVADTFPSSLTGVTFTSVVAGGATGNTAAGSGNISDTVNMPVGSSITYTVNATVAASATGSLSNTATVTAPGGVTDPTPGNNSATDTDTLTPSADVSVTKTDSPDPVQAGSNITYTVTVTNNGPSDAQSLSLSDAVPANTTLVSVTTPAGWTRTDLVPNGGTGTLTFTRPTQAAGASSVFTVVVNVNAGTATGTTISNTATVSSTTADPTPGNNSATATTSVQNQPNISIQDASLAEPKSGTANMIFTVTLSAPAPAGGVSVNYATQDIVPASINTATAGQDYTATSGTLNFAAGEQVKTILVSILSDNKKGENNESFLVVLSNPVNVIITDGTATGTIIENDVAGAVLISELRTSGPGGAGDDFVEIYNNSDSPHVVTGTSGGYGLFKMGATCNATPVLLGVIPNGTTIPARGHYLFTGSAYSLANYGGTGAAAGDQLMASDIESDRNVAIFKTGSLLEISTANRLDAVGFGSNVGATCDLFREGTTLTPTSGSTLEHSYFRDECGKKGNPSTFGNCPTGGFTQDSNVNADDFIFADTNATATVMGRRLGAPGPQNLGSPHFTLNVVALLLDASKSAAGNPNRVRDTTAIGPNAANGTMSIRRRFQNNTGAPVTKLRIRVVDISTTFIASGGVADLRLLTSGNTTDTVSDPVTCAASPGSPSTPCTITIFGTQLETPPAQPLGGGFNASATTGVITLAQPLAAGASINLQLLLGVQTTGSFKFFFNIEALP